MAINLDTQHNKTTTMKRLLLSLICASAIIAGVSQNYVALKDTVWGCRYFASDPATGQPTSTGNKKGTSGVSWPSMEGVEMKYYVRIPAGHCRADMYYTPYYGKALSMSVTITRTDNKKVIYNDKITTPVCLVRTEQNIDLFGDIQFPADTWYQIKLVSENGNRGIRNLSKMIFSHEANERVVTPTVFMAPSAHNNTWGSTDPGAVNENGYDWIYGEFLYPEEYAFPNRYLMCLGGSGYYSGIQVCGSNLRNTALFSAWDNGDTDKNPNLPSYLRSGAIDNNTDVAINRFGNEGTGVQSMMSNAHWKRGHWVQWLMNARPETTTITLMDNNGQESTTSYANTILTAWYKMADDPEWHYISTIRQSGTTHIFGNAGEYSFLECFSDGGGDNYVKCYMKNRFYRSVADGKWYNRNHMTPGHYNYNDGARECRYDYGHGAAYEYENCFYIEQGGFGQVNDANMYLPLATNTECVDTINIDDKYARINLAFRNNYYKQEVSYIDSLLQTPNAQQDITALAKEHIDNAGQPNYFGTKDITAIKEAYNEGAPSDITALANAIKETARNCNTIRYANVTARNFIGSQRAYLLQQTEGMGFLYAEMQDGKPVLKVGQKDRDDKCANWILCRSTKYNTMSIYNIGLGLYINFNSATLLDSEPQNISAFGRYGRGFYIGRNTSNAINVNADGTVKIGAHNAAGSQFNLHDNLSYTPLCKDVEKVIKATEAPGVFEEYKAMVPKILSMPENVLGAWTDAEELAQLRELYDDGNITIAKADQLISLIDNAQTISLNTDETAAFTIVSAARASESTPFLTIDADNYTYHKAATNKADQVWMARPKNGGHELSAQGRALNSLSDYTNANITTRETGNGAAFFMTHLGGGQYSISDIQNGPTAMSGVTSPVKTARTNSDGTQWYLKPAKEIKVSLNSIGIQSLYLDFGVKLPDNVTAYRIASLTADGPELEQLGDTIPARTPVVLKGESYGGYMLEIVPGSVGQSDSTIVRGTLLKKRGLKSKTFYTIVAKSGKPVIALALGSTVNANQCYILKEDMESLGLTATQYTIDFDKLTSVDDIKAQTTISNGKAYDLQGREANSDTKGIIIKDHKTILNK